MTSGSKHEQGAAVTAALELAQLGWPVLPLRGKIPRLSNGLHGATTDERAVRNWFELWPDANLGVRTGNGLVVLDVDGDDGADSLHALEKRYGRLPATTSAKTARGHHYYFYTDHPVPCSVGKLGPGLDVRGEGGYVVTPPSIHPETGRRYEWDNHPADLPAWPLPIILDQLLRAPQERKRTPAREWVRLLRRIPEGERNDSLARLAGHLLARNVDEHVAVELLRAVNDARCKPPLDDREVIGIFESILRRHLRKAPT